MKNVVIYGAQHTTALFSAEARRTRLYRKKAKKKGKKNVVIYGAQHTTALVSVETGRTPSVQRESEAKRE